MSCRASREWSRVKAILRMASVAVGPALPGTMPGKRPATALFPPGEVPQ